MINTVFITLMIIFGLQLLLAIMVIYLSKQKQVKSTSSIDTITVVIPFRNEADRIRRLLRSLNQLKLPKELKSQFVFADDHSEDNTASIIREELHIDHKIIKASQTGKKAAIHEAIQMADFDYILTLDADVQLDENYFLAITQLPPANMWVLPVQLEGKTLLEKLGAIDFTWIQLLTRALVNTQNPVLANGANLLFSKLHYHVAHEIRNDFHIASGDDLFLLAAFRNRGFRILTSDDQRLTVVTQSARGWINLLQQRKRWAQKMNRLVSAEVVTFAGFLILSQIAFVVAIFWIAIDPLFLIPILVKWVSEWLLTAFGRNKIVLEDVPVVFLHQIWFPVYMLAVFLWPVAPENRWFRK